MSTYEERRERQRRFLRQNLIWLVPLGMLAGVGLFIGLGFLVAWLWRVTLVDLFAVKPVSFWQAWGLILLSQILFKANMRPTMRTGSRRRCVPGGGDSPEVQTEPTPGS